MKTTKTLISGLTLSLALAAAPAFSQGRGVGLGVGVGSQTKVGIGGGAGVKAGANAQAAGADVGVRTNRDVQARTSAHGKTGATARSEAKSQERSNTSVAARIESNPKLATRVQAMLPAGMSITGASAGFKNQGQFIAALHASQNLNIPFDQLKAKMTGSNAMSLGAAIKAAKPEMSENQAKEDAKKAEAEASASASARTIHGRANRSASAWETEQK